MTFVKGRKKTGGRRKGVKNKLTEEVRHQIRLALEAAGDVIGEAAKKGPLHGLRGAHAYLVAAALGTDRERQAFLKLVGQTVERKVELDAKVHERVELINLTGLNVDKLKKLRPSVLKSLIEET